MDRTERVELTMLVMVTDKQGRMLVQDRLDPDWGGVCFPGGHIEPGESVVQAAIREVWEETGLTIENPRLCGVKQFPIENGRYLVFLLKTDRFAGTLQDSREGPVFWVTEAELPSYRLSGHMEELLRVFQSDDLSEMFLQKEQEQWKVKLF